MFKLKLTVGGKHVQGSTQSNDTAASAPTGFHKLGEALASAVKGSVATPSPTAAAAATTTPAPVASAPTASAAPAAAAAIVIAPSSSEDAAVTTSAVNSAVSASISATSGPFKKSFPSAHTHALGMTERHGLSPNLLFPPPKPLERTQLKIAGPPLSSFNNTLPARFGPSSVQQPATAVATANKAATATTKPKKKKAAAATATADAAPAPAPAPVSAAENAKPETKKPTPIETAAATTNGTSNNRVSNGVTSSNVTTTSPVPSTPSTPLSTASSNDAGAGIDAIPGIKITKKPKKPKAEREIDSALLRSGLTAGEIRNLLRAYSNEVIGAVCTQLNASDRRRNHLLSSVPSATLNAFVSRSNPAFAPLLASADAAATAATGTAAAVAVPGVPVPAPAPIARS